ncbi:alpha/beta fold hydrolase [Pseudogracilibacillus sp. SO30301A]|uniref:alpha/beta fold hydrolase n=1 Tax=Pseudogracilibacillus sp. SO30301A TaxID=3098291 RepID=UPI00300E4C9B
MKREMIKTNRGEFELFIGGKGKEPICISHLYQEYLSGDEPYSRVLGEYYKVILINLKNAGSTSKATSKNELAMEETIKDLESIREKLGYSSWAFAGHSTGGFLGLTYLYMHPEKLSEIILCGTAASNEINYSKNNLFNVENRKYRKDAIKVFFKMAFPLFSKKSKEKANKRFFQLCLYSKDKIDEYYKELKNVGISKTRMKAYTSQLRHYDVRGKIINKTVPALILCGKYDVQCPAEFSEEIHNLLPNSTLVIFKKSNHFPFIEEKDKFVSALDNFRHN